jgi:hypothetical protein
LSLPNSRSTASRATCVNDPAPPQWPEGEESAAEGALGEAVRPPRSAAPYRWHDRMGVLAAAELATALATIRRSHGVVRQGASASAFANHGA